MSAQEVAVALLGLAVLVTGDRPSTVATLSRRRRKAVASCQGFWLFEMGLDRRGVGKLGLPKRALHRVRSPGTVLDHELIGVV